MVVGWSAVGAALAAAIFAALAYRASLRAVDEARNQVEAARDANKISGRALAEAVGASVHFGQGEFRLHTDANEAPRIHISMPISNDGGTATRGLTYASVCAVHLRPPAEPFDRQQLAAARTHSLSLGPKQTARPLLCAYTPTEWGVILGRKADIYVFGRADYRDTVDPAQTHHVEFCTRLYDIQFSLSPMNRGPFAMDEECERHNCRDEECDAQEAQPPPRNDPGRL